MFAPPTATFRAAGPAPEFHVKPIKGSWQRAACGPHSPRQAPSRLSGADSERVPQAPLGGVGAAGSGAAAAVRPGGTRAGSVRGWAPASQWGRDGSWAPTRPLSRQSSRQDWPRSPLPPPPPLPLSLLAITVCEKMCLCGACCWSARYLLAAQGTTRYLVGIRWSPAQSPTHPSSLPLPPPPSLARSLERERKRARGREGGREGSGPPLLKFHFFPGYERFKPRSWLLMPPTPR